jgi:hypothetical protein
VDDTEIERVIRRAGYDIRRDSDSSGAEGGVYALRNGKRHTRSQPSLLALAEHLGCLERPVEFIEDREGLETVIASHAQERNRFAVHRPACRVAVFRRNKYVQLVNVAGNVTAMYELRADGLRRTSNGNLPQEVVAAFASIGTSTNEVAPWIIESRD